MVLQIFMHDLTDIIHITSISNNEFLKTSALLLLKHYVIYAEAN